MTPFVPKEEIMGIFLRAVVYGFGFSLGAALYKRASEAWGLDEPDTKSDAATTPDRDGDPDPLATAT